MNPGGTDRRIRLALWALIALFGAVSAYGYGVDALKLPHLGHLLMPYDSDNWQRLILVRSWLEGGSFFDHSVYGTNAPFFGIQSHWTRAIDILIAGIVQLTPAHLPMTQRLLLAAGWFPVMIGLGALAFLERAVGRPKSWQPLLCLAILAFLNTGTDSYFVPGYVDHHGTLAMLWCAVLALIMRPPDKTAALALGCVLGVMIWISVESLLPVSFVFAALGIYALFRPERTVALALTTLAAAVVVTAAVVIQQPQDTLSYTVLDTVSTVHVFLLSLCAVAAVGLAGIFPRVPVLRHRFLTGALASALIIGAMSAVFPIFFLGPRAEMDPFIIKKFLPEIFEAKPITQSPYQTILLMLWQPALALALLLATCRARRWQRKPWQVFILCGALAVMLIATCFAIRWNYYLQPVAMLTIALLLPLFAGRIRFILVRALPFRHKAWVLLLYAGIGVSLFAHYAGRQGFKPLSLCSLNQQYAIQTAQVQARLGDASLTLLTTPSVSGAVRFFTPYASISGNYDREVEGLKDIDALVRARTAEAALPLMKKRAVGGMIVCPSVYEGDTFFGTLADESARPAWLEYLGTLDGLGEKIPKVMLFRVNASAAGTE